MSKTLDTIRLELLESQWAFARDVDRIVARMHDYSAQLSPALAEMSHGDALQALQADTMKAFARCLERQ